MIKTGTLKFCKECGKKKKMYRTDVYCEKCRENRQDKAIQQMKNHYNYKLFIHKREKEVAEKNYKFNT